MVENGSRENEVANKTQRAKNGSHAARAIAHRRMIGRTIALEIISTRALLAAQFTDADCLFAESGWHGGSAQSRLISIARRSYAEKIHSEPAALCAGRNPA